MLAGRASFGTIPGGINANIPFDKLFYAGGGGSVRGFAYQSAGPRDAFGTIRWAAPASSKAASSSASASASRSASWPSSTPARLSDTWPNFSQFAPRVGTGVGVRYYTDFGPARLDVGIPLNKRRR